MKLAQFRREARKVMKKNPKARRNSAPELYWSHWGNYGVEASRLEKPNHWYVTIDPRWAASDRRSKEGHFVSRFQIEDIPGTMLPLIGSPRVFIVVAKSQAELKKRVNSYIERYSPSGARERAWISGPEGKPNPRARRNHHLVVGERVKLSDRAIRDLSARYRDSAKAVGVLRGDAFYILDPANPTEKKVIDKRVRKHKYDLTVLEGEVETVIGPEWASKNKDHPLYNLITFYAADQGDGIPRHEGYFVKWAEDSGYAEDGRWGKTVLGKALVYFAPDRSVVSADSTSLNWPGNHYEGITPKKNPHRELDVGDVVKWSPSYLEENWTPIHPERYTAARIQEFKAERKHQEKWRGTIVGLRMRSDPLWGYDVKAVNPHGSTYELQAKAEEVVPANPRGFRVKTSHHFDRAPKDNPMKKNPKHFKELAGLVRDYLDDHPNASFDEAFTHAMAGCREAAEWVGLDSDHRSFREVYGPDWEAIPGMVREEVRRQDEHILREGGSRGPTRPRLSSPAHARTKQEKKDWLKWEREKRKYDAADKRYRAKKNGRARRNMAFPKIINHPTLGPIQVDDMEEFQALLASTGGAAAPSAAPTPGLTFGGGSRGRGERKPYDTTKIVASRAMELLGGRKAICPGKKGLSKGILSSYGLGLAKQRELITKVTGEAEFAHPEAGTPEAKAQNAAWSELMEGRTADDASGALKIAAELGFRCTIGNPRLGPSPTIGHAQYYRQPTNAGPYTPQTFPYGYGGRPATYKVAKKNSSARRIGRYAIQMEQDYPGWAGRGPIEANWTSYPTYAYEQFARANPRSNPVPVAVIVSQLVMALVPMIVALGQTQVNKFKRASIDGKIKLLKKWSWLSPPVRAAMQNKKLARAVAIKIDEVLKDPEAMQQIQAVSVAGARAAQAGYSAHKAGKGLTRATPGDTVGIPYRKRRNPRLRPVPSHISPTPRAAADGLYALGKGPKWPIGDLFHARLALIYAMAPSNFSNAKRILAAVKKAYPQYNWNQWWEHHMDKLKARGRKDKTLASKIELAAANPRKISSLILS